ncbi:RTC4-like domain-containing protein [Crassisporium funariophilum]|nr:RTC4-like domain-containing protein [Crassisporium funariophilum]
MENLYSNLSRKGQTLETASSLRLPNRPLANPNPKAFQDLGISLAPKDGSSSQKSKIRPTRTASLKSMRGTGEDKRDLSSKSNSNSEDEIDFLSQSDHLSSPAPTKSTKTSDRKYMHHDGKTHDWDPRFPPSQTVALKSLKFKKNKMAGSQDETPVASSSLPKPQLGLKENDNGYTFGPRTVVEKKQQASKEKQFARAGSPRIRGSKTKKQLEDDSDGEVVSPLGVKSSNRRDSPREPLAASGPPRPRPVARPTHKSQAAASGSNPHNRKPAGSTSQPKSNPAVPALESFALGRGKATIGKKHSRSPSPDDLYSQPMEKTRAASDFPVPLSSPQAFPTMSPLGGMQKIRPKPIPKKTNLKNNSEAKFAGVSRFVSAFPMPSPQSGSKIMADDNVQLKGKGKAKASPINDSDDAEDEDEDNGKRQRLKPQAFPMSKQVLASIGSPSVPGRSSRSEKRPSEGGSGDDRHLKRGRLEHDLHLFEDEGDSISISPNVDPRTLCPYCDTPLPSSPTPLLLSLLAATAKKSRKDPRPSNPLGLKAPLATFIATCQRHRFEGQILPEALRKGWPKTIKWKKLRRRVEAMEEDLRAIIDDPDEDVLSEDDVEMLFASDKKKNRKRRGAKAKSIFWMEVLDEVKKKGTRAVTGVRGQFANFEKTQPGYYGELGAVIINQTLFDMFPPATFDPALISPLTSNEFVLRILVPEVALRLIMEDRGLEGEEAMPEALSVLRESSAYGVAMFPEDGGEWGTGKKRRDEGDDAIGVGDQIVMERARKRRKELEEEDEREEEDRRVAEDMKSKSIKEKDKAAGRKGKENQEEVDDDPSEKSALVGNVRPRPRPILKASSSSMSVVPAEEHEPQRPQSRSSIRGKRQSHSRSRSRTLHNDGDTDPPSDQGAVIELTTSDSDHRPSRETQRRLPSASETKAQIYTKLPSSKARAASRGMESLNLGSDAERPLPSAGEKRELKAQRKTKSVTRCTSGVNASSDSDASTTAVVNNEPRPRKKPPHRNEMDVDVGGIESDADDDNQSKVVDELIMKTPVAKRNSSSTIRVFDLDDEETPKAAPTSSRASQLEDSLPPLMLAQRRATNKAQPQKPAGSGREPKPSSVKRSHDEWSTNLRDVYHDSTDNEEPTKDSNFKWLLNDSSQSSIEGKRRR